MIDAMKSNLAPQSVTAQTPAIASNVLEWWDRHRRTLPWRAGPGQTSDPYLVWLSEVLLQQTTVQAVIPYFERFKALWPRLEDLAAAPLEEVMRAFAGLGYYSRARNLHACAQEVVRRGGSFPRTEAELRTLPGIGAYTAAAVAAIAFDQPAAPVDGNIARIVTRLHAIEQPIAKARTVIARAAAAQTPPARPGDFAQALMDIGATICTPRNPDCPACPIRFACIASAKGHPQAYPRKAARKLRPHRRGAAFFAQAVDGSILLRTRAPSGLLGGTLELPGTQWSADYAPDAAASGAPFPAPWLLTPGLVEQAFTHFSLALNVYSARVTEKLVTRDGCFWIGREEIDGAALSSLMRKAVAHGQRFADGGRANEPVSRRRNGSSRKTPSAQ
jgi:A/G-specific adenine glycosylase